MTNTRDDDRGGRGRTTWLLLALVAIAAIVGLALYLSNNRREAGAAAEGASAEASAGLQDECARRAMEEAASDTGEALSNAGGDIAAGARETADAARTAVERSTDGDPDSDNNEPAR